MVGLGSTDPRVLEQVLELAHAGLVLALLLAGCVVAAVLLEVTLVAGGRNAVLDLLAGRTLTVGELRHEAVVGLLGQPGDRLLAHEGKGYPRRART